jgi:modulator of drug activity B
LTGANKLVNQTVLIINGTDNQYDYASKGNLNTLLSDTAAEYLKDHGFEILRTTLKNGYEVDEEDDKWRKADLIIFQFPIYWFSAPAVLKRYFEDIYNGKQFYKGGTEYGRGGLLTGKSYLVSTTWNAPIDVFNDPSSFFKGQSIDDVLSAFHYTHDFIGLKKLPGISFNDVVKNPDATSYVQELKEHLKNIFDL